MCTHIYTHWHKILVKKKPTNKSNLQIDTYSFKEKKWHLKVKFKTHINTLNSWFKCLHALSLGNNFREPWVMYNSHLVLWHTHRWKLTAGPGSWLWKASDFSSSYILYVWKITLLYLPTFILILQVRTPETEPTVPPEQSSFCMATLLWCQPPVMTLVSSSLPNAVLSLKGL